MALTDNLVAYWPLTEASGQRNDIVGGSHLTDVNSTASGVGKAALGMVAADFEADNLNALTCADSAALSLGADQAFTFSAWVNVESLTASRAVLAKGNTLTYQSEYYVHISTSGAVYFRVGNGSTYAGFSSTHKVSVGVWAFIVVWHDPDADILGIQIDGKIPATAVWAGGTQDTSRDFDIGRASWLSTVPFDGRICAVGFWKRVLTSEERVGLYAGGFGIDYPFLTTLQTALISHWRLDESSGTRYDSHSYGNDLTDNNTVGSGTGKIGSSANFVRTSSEYLSCADNFYLSVGASDFTVAAWVKLNTVPSAGQYMGIVGRDDVTSPRRDWILSVNGDSSRFGFGTGRGTGTTVDAALADSYGAVSSGVWVFIVGWHDRISQKNYIQVNNGAVDEAASLGEPIDSSATFRIGLLGTGTHFLNGDVDSVSFWKRTLTSDERASLYAGGAGLDYPFTVGTTQSVDAIVTSTSTTGVSVSAVRNAVLVAGSSSTVSASVSVTRRIASVSTGASAATVTTRASRKVFAVSASASSVAAIARSTLRLIAVANSQATASASASLVGGSSAAASNFTSTVSAQVRVTRRVSVSPSVSSSANAQANRLRGVAAVAVSVSTVSVVFQDLGGVRQVSVSVTALSSVSAALFLVGDYPMATTVAIQSGLSADVGCRRKVTPVIGGLSTVGATAIRNLQFTPQASATSTLVVVPVGIVAPVVAVDFSGDQASDCHVLARRLTYDRVLGIRNPPPQSRFKEVHVMSDNILGSEVETAPCIIAGGGGGTGGGGGGDECFDPVFHMENPTLCTGTPPTLTRLVLDPPVGACDVGGAFQFKAWAIFSDGREREIGIEPSAVWASGPDTVTENLGQGRFSGKAEGDAAVQVAWKGLTANARMGVHVGCYSYPFDVVLCLEGNIMTNFGPGSFLFWLMAQLRLQGKPWFAANQIADDRVSVVTFGPHADVVLDWTDTYPGTIASSSASVMFRGLPRLSIGSGLEAAWSLLSRARPTSRKIVILATTGLETVCNPSPEVPAGLIKGSGAILAVVGLNRPNYQLPFTRPLSGSAGGGSMYVTGHNVLLSGQALLCGVGPARPIPVQTFLDSLGTPGFVAYPSTIGGAGAFVAAIPRTSCEEYDGQGGGGL